MGSLFVGEAAQWLGLALRVEGHLLVPNGHPQVHGEPLVGQEVLCKKERAGQGGEGWGREEGGPSRNALPTFTGCTLEPNPGQLRMMSMYSR